MYKNQTPTGNFHLQGVDVFKYIMALAVVAIHVEYCFDLHFPAAVKWFNSLAVPFFFTVSGFLMSRTLSVKSNDNDRAAYLKARATKILKLFLTWLAIYLPLTLVWGRYNHVEFSRYIQDNIMMIVTGGEMELAYPLWFLYSLFLFTGAMWLTFNREKLRACVYTAIILSYIGYLQLIQVETESATAAVIMKYYPFRAVSGGIFVMAGMLVYRFADFIMNRYVALTMIALSFAMSVFNLPFYEIIGGCGIFLCSVLIGFKGSERRFMALRTSSMWIYYLHMYVIAFFLMLPLPAGLNTSAASIYIAVVTITAALASVLTYLQKKPSFALLGMLTR
ncbi:MAG: acyltransferase [Muribaculaceae bacterium]|nr:acyltransferase [Muribaculaceae bacterium]